jgi:hypothetical protein
VQDSPAADLVIQRSSETSLRYFRGLESRPVRSSILYSPVVTIRYRRPSRLVDTAGPSLNNTLNYRELICYKDSRFSKSHSYRRVYQKL